MSVARSFADMLNEYLHIDLLKEELTMRDYILSQIDKKNDWKGGTAVVPFRGARASSVKFAGLVPSNDISQSQYVRGQITTQRDVWSSCIFNSRDLNEHNGKVPETTFLELLHDEVEDVMDYTKEVTSTQMGSGPHFATLTGDGQAGGTFTVDKIDRFQIGMRFTLDDDNSASQDVYVTAININTATVTVSASRGGSALNISAYTTAQNAKCYYDGVFDSGGSHNTFVSCRAALLSSANGGDTSLHGVTKTSWPHLQAYNYDGSSINAVNILEEMFDALTEQRQIGKGRVTTMIMSLKNYGSCMKQLEIQKGSYRVVEDPKESLFGWYEMKIGNVTGQRLTLVGVQEFDNDIIVGLDWRGVDFISNGWFHTEVDPDTGSRYYRQRGTTGYQLITDQCLWGELRWKNPGHHLIIYGISY